MATISGRYEASDEEKAGPHWLESDASLSTSIRTEFMSGAARAIIAKHKEELLGALSNTPFVVFLCGPTLKDLSRPSAMVRSQIKLLLEAENFEVVLGEDDGLEDARLQTGLNAQDNELEFIRSQCNAVVLVADSVGAFCELGLFSWHYVHGASKHGRISPGTDCIVVVDEKYKSDKSYLNEGPGRSVRVFGSLCFVDFGSFDPKPLVDRLKDRRAIFSIERRGRPRRTSK